MDLGSVIGIIVTLMLLVPGGIGDVWMRSLHRMPEPRSDFRQLLSAVTWSISALAVVELSAAAVTRKAMGSFILKEVPTISSSSDVGSLAGRYAVLVLVSLALPSLARWLLLVLATRFSPITLAQPSFDLIAKEAPRAATGFMFAKVAKETRNDRRVGSMAQ